MNLEAETAEFTEREVYMICGFLSTLWAGSRNMARLIEDVDLAVNTIREERHEAARSQADSLGVSAS